MSSSKGSSSFKRPVIALLVVAGLVAWLSQPMIETPETSNGHQQPLSSPQSVEVEVTAEAATVDKKRSAATTAVVVEEGGGNVESPAILANDDAGHDEMDATSCEAGQVKALTNQLWYTGPAQAVTREGNMNMRCFQGQHYEDLFMFQHYLANVGGGFFIELGALDGFSYSVTYFFEKFLRWDGLLIEASPLNHRLYQTKMRKLKKRRRTVPYVVAAACNEEKPMTYVAKEGTGAGIFEFLPKVEQDRVMKEGCVKVTNISDYDPEKSRSISGGCALIPIKCVHLGDELRRRQVTHVDLFVLDVQGAELNVLKTLRLQEIPIRYFIIELDSTAPEKDEQVRCILRKNGYDPIGRLDVNELWIKRDFDPKKYSASYKTPDPSAYGRCWKESKEHGAPSQWIKAPKFSIEGTE